MTTGEKIRASRLNAGFTQKRLSELTGIAEPTIRKYESNRLKPKKETLERIAKPLGVFYLNLYGDEEMLEFGAYVRAGIKMASDARNKQIYDFSVEYIQYLQQEGYSFTEAEHQLVLIFNQLDGITQQMAITDLAQISLDPRHRKDKKAIIDDEYRRPAPPQSPPEGTDTTPPEEPAENP